MTPVTDRAQRTAQTLLDNESLTADLDDAAAQALIDWGVASVEAIARDTAGLDDADAEQAMEPRLRAVRRLMRRVNRWVAGREAMSGGEAAAHLEEIVAQAAVIYAGTLAPPSRDERIRFLVRGHADEPPQMIRNLRTLIEDSAAEPAAGEGGTPNG